MKLDILFEDDWLVAINKPVRLPVHATHDPLRPHLQGLLENQLGKKLVLFHRLDVDTTGVVLLGKDPSINKAMTDAFRDRSITKKYLVGVEGFWPAKTKKIEGYIKKISGGRWVFESRGKSTEYSVTEFEFIEKAGDKSLLWAKPQTGRTHQIRLHCQSEGHSVVGDPLYGVKDLRGLPLALHAFQLELIHPVLNSSLTIRAPVWDFWKSFGFKDIQKLESSNK